MTRFRGLRGNLKSRPAGPAMHGPHMTGQRPGATSATPPLNAYTWQRGRPAALIRPPDRRCLDTPRRTAGGTVTLHVIKDPTGNGRSTAVPGAS